MSQKMAFTKEKILKELQRLYKLSIATKDAAVALRCLEAQSRCLKLWDKSSKKICLSNLTTEQLESLVKDLEHQKA